ncbi:hypothetical protein ABTD85_24430, partial [Acinetobacter baumannii]
LQRERRRLREGLEALERDALEVHADAPSRPVNFRLTLPDDPRNPAVAGRSSRRSTRPGLARFWNFA